MLSKDEAREKIIGRIEEIQEAHEHEIFVLTWDDVYGSVRLMWNSPFIDDTYLEFEACDHSDIDWDD